MDGYSWVANLDYRTQMELCGDNGTPNKALHALFVGMGDDLDSTLSQRIVRHPNVAAETLRGILTHPHSQGWTLFHAAARPELPRDFLEELARADFGNVHRAHWMWEGLMNNPNIPEDLKEEVRQKREMQYVVPRLRSNARIFG